MIQRPESLTFVGISQGVIMANGTRYPMLLDEAATQATERLRRAYGLQDWAGVYSLAQRLLTWVTEQRMQDTDVGSHLLVRLLRQHQPQLLVC